MCYRADAFIGTEAANDRAELLQLGWLGVDSPDVIGILDPVGDVGGIEIRQHPRMLIAQHPELWRTIDEWNTGVRREIRAGDSNWLTVALSTMKGAHAREAQREAKRLAGGNAP